MSFLSELHVSLINKGTVNAFATWQIRPPRPGCGGRPWEPHAAGASRFCLPFWTIGQLGRDGADTFQSSNDQSCPVRITTSQHHNFTSPLHLICRIRNNFVSEALALVIAFTGCDRSLCWHSVPRCDMALILRSYILLALLVLVSATLSRSCCGLV